jgi:uncharacterized protein YegP (UPF0339 family)
MVKDFIMVTEKPTKPVKTVEYYKSANGLWYWRARNFRNKKIVLTGAEGYHNESNVKRAINKEVSTWAPGSFNGPFNVTSV